MTGRLHGILQSESMSRTQKLVLASAAALFIAWFGFHFDRFFHEADGTAGAGRVVCLVLGILFFPAILFRPSPTAAQTRFPGWIAHAAGLSGVAVLLTGIVFDRQQLNWLGGILLLYSCLQWSLPQRFSRNIPPALLLLYWVHPIPSCVFTPFSLTLQNASVQGTEWLLHCFNVPAWADGTMLRMETVALDVPRSCSGMTTAIAVLVSCLGTGLLFRIRWYELAVLVMLGLLQVLILNIMRIALVAVATQFMPPESVSGHIHNSLGLLLVSAIVLAQVEAAVWLSRRTRRLTRERNIRDGVVEPEDRAGILHPFWRHVFRSAWAIMAIAVVSAVIAGTLYKRRPHHRSRMVGRLVDSFEFWNPADAERAAAEAVRIDGKNIDARLSLAQVLLSRKKYCQAFTELDRIPENDRDVADIVTRAQALVGMKRLKDAVVLIDNLTDDARRIPQVAIARAEIAAEQDDARCVASNVILAVADPSPALLRRVRTLFPYLAAREEWKAIVNCDRPLPYDDHVHAAIAVDAYFRLNNIPGMAKTLTRVVKNWPEDPLFLTHLLAMAILRPEDGWDNVFANNFLRNLRTLDNDHLSACMKYCFRLGRPDLAWLAFRRLSSIEPQDPGLHLSASEFADVWFTFRNRHLGLNSVSPETTVDLRPLFIRTRNVWPYALLWNGVPFAEEFTSVEAGSVSKKHLKICLEELERRERANVLNQRTEMLFVTALTRAGRYLEAGQRLDRLDRTYPDKRREVLCRRLMLSDLQRHWDSSYEISRQCVSLVRDPGLESSLSQLNALLHLRLGTHALIVAERLHRLFPNSSRATLALITVLQTCGFEEEVLFLMDKVPGTAGPLVGAAALRDTERFLEADRFAAPTERTGLPREERRQSLFLPMAELTVTPPRPEITLTDRDMDREAAQFALEAEESVSPYVAGLKRLIANWYRCRGRSGSSDPAKWQEVGRDETERAVSLHELATLLIRQQRAGEADKILAGATLLLPDSAPLWQSRVASSGGDKAAIEQARRACPSDSELWLAGLVARTRDTGPGKWALQEVLQATAQPRFPVGAVVRAGDFLLRNGMTNAAAVAARYSIRHANGLLPAYVLGLRCALTTGDMDWALSCASQAAMNALDPTPFQMAIVDINAHTGQPTADLALLLNRLHTQFPADPQWPERLGILYFQKGDTRAAYGVFSSMVAKNLADRMQVPSLLVVAEAARLEGLNREAAEILARAYERCPDNSDILNNFIYVLASDQKTLGQAQALLPRLLEKRKDSSSVFDTAAVVYFKAGLLRRAAEFSEKALQLVRPGDYAAAEIHLNAAEIRLLMGDCNAARTELNLARRPDLLPLAIERRRRTLLSAVEKKAKDVHPSRREAL